MYVVCTVLLFSFVSFRLWETGGLRCFSTKPPPSRFTTIIHAGVRSVAWNKQLAFFYIVLFFFIIFCCCSSWMAFCSANAFICLCPHNLHNEDEPRESGIPSSDRILIQITIGESKTLFFLSQSHTYTHNIYQRFYQNAVVYLCDILLLLFFCYFILPFFPLLTTSFYFTLFEVPLISGVFLCCHFFIIFMLLLSHTFPLLVPLMQTCQLTWRFVCYFKCYCLCLCFYFLIIVL